MEFLYLDYDSMKTTSKQARSEELFDRAKELIPGGVNSPVRAFRSVGATPVFAARGRGSRLIDADENAYIDYIGAWGPLILGHSHPAVQSAIRDAVERGTGYGLPTEQEVRIANLIKAAVPSIEKLRLVNSGTEATMSAIRLARGFTQRNLILKFSGCYHGHVDALLVKAGSGVVTFSLPESSGVPPEFAQLTLTAPYNDSGAVRRLFENHPAKIAAVILEPVAGNMGCVPPVNGFLSELREITADDGALLIFDEVMTGFRLGFGGVQESSGVSPDLTTLGKIIGGGLPVGAYGGRSDVMSHIAPDGPVYQAGTLAGNPLSVAAGMAVLEELRRRPEVYAELEQRTARLVDGLHEGASRVRLDVCINRVGSMFTVFFTPGPVTDFESACTADREQFACFFRAMLDRGILFPPSQFEAAFVSAAHSDDDIDATVRAAKQAFEIVSQESSRG